jgi:argininosuccinate lyase
MKNKIESNKPWGGRFTEATASSAEIFSASIHFDMRLYRHDIAGSQAHAKMLAKVGLISGVELEQILSGLSEIKAEIESNTFVFRPELEDIHMNIEKALVEKVGQAGEKLHTARSRNDQVALDMRLYLRDKSQHIVSLISDMQKCQDIPTCSGHSLFFFLIICWPTMRCLTGIRHGCPIA